MHKDYSSGNPIQISVYSNKIIIWNEGQLPDDWTVESLKTKHPSRPYNPDIANCFFRAGLIEAWGRGTIKILNECRQAKVALPVFKYDLSGFVIEFSYIYENRKIIELNRNEKANSPEEKIINFISENNNITIGELVQKTNIPKISIERFIQKLKDANQLKREGSNKFGKWIILK